MSELRPPSLLGEVARRFNAFDSSSVRGGKGWGRSLVKVNPVALRNHPWSSWCNDDVGGVAASSIMAHSLRFPFLFVMQ
jgi:hypothetical protein